MINKASKFYALLTTLGARKLAAANAQGKPWTITHMGVGDARSSQRANVGLRYPHGWLIVRRKNTAEAGFSFIPFSLLRRRPCHPAVRLRTRPR
jgi:hypothetical protein